MTGCAYTAFFFGQDYSGDACLKHLFTNVYLWLTILALLAAGKAKWDKTSPFAAYMTRNEFGIYVVHYVIVLYACWGLKTLTTLPPVCDYLLALAAVLLLPSVVYALLRRIPVVRFLLFGEKKSAPPRAAG